METSSLNSEIRALLLCGFGLLLAILLGWNIGSQNYYQLFAGAVVVIVACAALVAGRSFWVLAIASSFLDGTFPILGGQFTPFQILMVIGVLKFLVGDVVLRRTRTKVGSRFDAIMIAGFMGILTLHGLHDRFGMRFLGSSTWGGRNYVNVYVGLAAFFVIQSIPMQSKVWAKLPYVVLAVVSFDLSIAIITTIFPRSIYVIFPFYSAVSSGGLEELIVGTRSDLSGRFGAYGNFGVILTTIVLASVPLTKVLSPKNVFRLIQLGLGSVGVLASGYRTSVFHAMIAYLAAGVRDLKYGVVAILPLIAASLLALSAVNSQFFRLPKQVQRSLIFVPGNWNADTQRDAEGSNRFRQQVWTVFIREYFPMHPWFGRGFGFRSQIAQQSASQLRYNPNWDRDTVEVGNIHNGFLASVDALGIVGTIFFVGWNLRILGQTFRVSFRQRGPPGIALRFLALYVAIWVIGYWLGAYTVGSFLPRQFALAGVFLRLRQTMDSDSVRSGLTDAKIVGDALRQELVST